MIIAKPFHTNVLIAKLQAIYRRVYELGEKRTLNWQDALVDLSKDSIQKGDSVIYLSKTEMIILEMLIQKQNQIVTRDTLITRYGMMKRLCNDNALTVNVNRLRKNCLISVWIHRSKLK